MVSLPLSLRKLESAVFFFSRFESLPDGFIIMFLFSDSWRRSSLQISIQISGVCVCVNIVFFLQACCYFVCPGKFRDKKCIYRFSSDIEQKIYAGESHSPTDLFWISKPYDPLIGSSELYIVRWSPDSEALKLWKGRLALPIRVLAAVANWARSKEKLSKSNRRRRQKNDWFIVLFETEAGAK